MALIIREIVSKYNYVFHDLRDTRLDDYFLMSSPLPVVLIIAAYLYFVTSLGPRLMRNRPAFDLSRVIQVYDAVQIVLSVFLIERGLTLAWLGTYSYRCEPVDYSSSKHAIQVMECCYLYMLIKFIDLLDTVFFVLRKKNAQVTFLHVYHHTAMATGVWIGVKFVAGGNSIFVGCVNSVVHAVMYSYYLVTSLYPQHKNNIWWKKHITQLQMIQFLMVIVHSTQTLLWPTCNYPQGYMMFLVPQNFFMLVMFYDFYRKAYFPSSKPAVSKDKPLAEKRD